MPSTVDFLKHVLPDEGWYAAFIKETKRHSWFDSTDRLGDFLLAQDAAARTVYFACAAFTERTRRTQTSARAARSFWLDVDVGEGKPYADACEAAQAASDFCRRTGLPDPVYVGSGNGIYLHWPLVDALEPAAWSSYARGLKVLCQREGLAADPSRTADIASILRAPGTHNRKNGLNKEVLCGPLVGPYPIEAFAELLKHGSELTPSRTTPRLALALANTAADEPRFSEPIASACGQLGGLRSSHGCLPEPLWYAGLGILAWCDDGEHFAHEWSAGYSGYTRGETDERLARARALSGATTCEHFHSLNPKTCEACPHWRKIKSPISLSRRDDPSGTGSVQRTDIFGAPLKAAEQTQPVGDLPQLPHDFFWRNDGALVTKTGTAGGAVDIVVSRYPIFLERVQTGEVRGEFNLIFKQRLPERGWMEIPLSARLLFSHSSGAELADRGANIHEQTHFLRYVRGAMDLFYAANRLSMRYDQFGWKQDDTAFLYGLDLYGPAGTTHVMGNDELQVRCKEDWVGPCKGGDLEGWKQAVNALFASGCEPQSVALLAAFAAPLMRFQERDEGGAIIHLVTRESGTGKSTALIGAASVWGRREGLGLTNEDTKVSKALTLGALGNLPVVYDEITLRDPEAIRAFVVNFTNGRDKMRATRAGAIHHTASTWQTILISAANSSLVDALSVQNNPEAPAYRIMEFSLDVPKAYEQGDRLRKALRNNSGYAGKAFLEWLVQPGNLAWTKATLQQVTQQTWDRTGFRSEHRFWVRTLAAIAVAGVIVKQLGLVEFSVERIMAWLFEAMGARDTQHVREWAMPALAEFLNENTTNALIMATAYVPGHKARPLQEFRGHRLSMRYEVNTNRCLIAATALREWLVKRELSYQEMLRALEAQGVVTRKRMQATLGAGTDIPGGQVWCVEINTAHEAIAGVVAPKNENVVPMQRAAQ